MNKRYLIRRPPGKTLYTQMAKSDCAKCASECCVMDVLYISGRRTNVFTKLLINYMSVQDLPQKCENA